LSLEAAQGQRVALTGSKSATRAMLMATAGLWHDGQGQIRRPGPTEVMFVPPRPCRASGRLRHLLTHGLGQEVSDEQLRTVLNEVGLEETIARAGGLDAERDWTGVLSASELQALTFARLLLAHPRFAFLDEPTGIMEESLAQRVYQALAHSSITYLSAGCPPTLMAYHNWRLELQEDGSWRMEPVTYPAAADGHAPTKADTESRPAG
jgi:putative ATP-binding cassette transporter